MGSFSITGNILDIVQEIIYPGELIIENGLIKEIRQLSSANGYILPGLIDSHIHIESSMVSPLEFAKKAVQHGTVAVVTDPHEIANVMGVEGINFMIDNSRLSPLKFYFGAPSCVPATTFETAGALINAQIIDELLKRDEIFFLSEMMNFPGVLSDDKEVLQKIQAAKKFNKPIDGHAPGLMGSDLKKYISYGISTDHECLTYDEAIEKIKLGLTIQIREGSASKSLDDFVKLIEEYPNQVMLCSDDLHPDDLLKGHINLLMKRSLDYGINIFKLYKAALLNPIKHYKLNVGYLQTGQPADFILMEDLEKFDIKSTFIDGKKVFEKKEGISFKDTYNTVLINNFSTSPIQLNDLIVKNEPHKLIRIIDIMDQQLVTKEIFDQPKVENDVIISDTERDYLKIAVVNRYQKVVPAIAFVHNFGLKYGAVASSISHDCHNIIAIGANDLDLMEAINAVIEMKGGISFANNGLLEKISLPLGGLMSSVDAEEIAINYQQIQDQLKSAGSQLVAPLMTLSFMALIVIPELKIYDKGLFDVRNFKNVSLLIDNK